MSAVIKVIEVKLTQKQADQIQDEWNSTIKESGRVMLAIQPLGGSFRTQYLGPPMLRIAFLDAQLFEAIQRIINRHRKSRP